MNFSGTTLLEFALVSENAIKNICLGGGGGNPPPGVDFPTPLKVQSGLEVALTLPLQCISKFSCLFLNGIYKFKWFFGLKTQIFIIPELRILNETIPVEIPLKWIFRERRS